jgi:cobalt-precorrin 5A hydrolase
MDLGQAVIVAGLGYRKGVSAAEIESALTAAIRESLRAGEKVARLSAPERKAGEQGLLAAAAARGVRIVSVPQEALERASPRALTSSARSSAVMNVPSVAECAALAACGPAARLLAPRVVVGPVTCALAVGEVAP